MDGHVHIFAEPGQVILTGADVTLHVHSTNLGAFKNYDRALDYLCRHGKSGRICVLEDDYIYCNSLNDKLKSKVRTKETFGYFNLFTNGYHPGIGDKMIKPGWNNVDYGFEAAWGVAYVFDRAFVPRLRAHEVYQATMNEKNRVIDGAVSEVCKRLKLNMWYHNPSLIYSIGFSSTLGNEFKTDGYRFRGK